MNAKNLPFTVNVEVIFRDLDSQGHVNNSVYFTYLETARIKYIKEIKSRYSASEMNMIVAHASCDYKEPAFLGELLEVRIAITRFGNKSFDFAYGIHTRDSRLIATAKTVQVVYDYQADRSIELPAEFKSAVLKYQGTLSFQDKYHFD